MLIELDLEPAQAAALLRFAEKSGHQEAMAVLYAHLPMELRKSQASQICSALIDLEMALENAGARQFPWVETGVP